MTFTSFLLYMKTTWRNSRGCTPCRDSSWSGGESPAPSPRYDISHLSCFIWKHPGETQEASPLAGTHPGVEENHQCHHQGMTFTSFLLYMETSWRNSRGCTPCRDSSWSGGESPAPSPRYDFHIFLALYGNILEKLKRLHPLPGLILEWRRITSAITKV